MPARGCGESRTRGAVYIECPLSGDGRPVEHFLADRPYVVDPEEFGLSAIGIKIMKRPGAETIYDVWDIVGQEYYPNVSDFVEEVKCLGLSRKIATTSRFDLLTRESKIVLL